MAELKDGKAAENANENPVVNEVIGGGESTNEDKGVVVSKIKTNKQVVAELLAKGCNKIAGIRVRSSIVTPKDNYVMVSLSLERGIPGYVADGEGVFTKGETAIVFASSYSIASVLKDNDETAWAANQLIQNPKGLEVILAGATLFKRKLLRMKSIRIRSVVLMLTVSLLVMILLSIMLLRLRYVKRLSKC